VNYFYDVLINMNEEEIFNFYEWENYDPIELVKKIPLYRVNTKTLKDFYLCNVKVSEEFANELLDKTLIKNNTYNKTIKYACLLCDTKNSIVVEFNVKGKVISKSRLLLEDEANVLEFIYTYKETIINYQIEGKNIIKNFLRQEEMIKKVIKTEFNTIIEDNNNSKLKYLFNEWFGYEENNIDIIKIKIKKELKKENILKAKEIYNLIMLSYNKS